MKYVVDTEFIDTPEHSELISLAIVREDNVSIYFEFEYPPEAITPWLAENVVPHLDGHKPLSTFAEAANTIDHFMHLDPKPEFWAYYGAYDWYWLCRVFGGFMKLPKQWGIVAFNDFAHMQRGVPDVAGAGHNAMNDARSILAAMKALGVC